MFKCHLKDQKTKWYPDNKRRRFPKNQIDLGKYSIFFHDFFFNWKVISSRHSFQLSSHLEYVFILKFFFKNYLYLDKVCSLLLTVSIWPFWPRQQLLALWQEDTLFADLNIWPRLRSWKSVLTVSTVIVLTHYRIEIKWNNKLLMFVFLVCSQTLEVMKSLIEKEIGLLQTHYNWFNKFYRHWYINY